MFISIKYNSIWKNSFLDGDNNSSVPKKGRKYISSIESLKKEENHKKREITHNTVMGVLNRLIGDQRKLWQAKENLFEDSYYFEKLEDKISFVNKEVVNNEMIYLRNLKKGNFDKSSWSGIINDNHPLLSSSYSRDLFSVLFYDLDTLLNFIFTNEIPKYDDFSLSSLNIKQQCEKIVDKIKKVEANEELLKAITVLNKSFPDIDYFPNEKVDLKAFYYSSLYLMINKLSETEDLSLALSKSGNVTGVSKRTFTGKDFLSPFANKKIIYGNPYKTNYWVETDSGKKKKIEVGIDVASGVLTINLDIDKDKSKELKELINNAGVGTFYLGKKGLAYVDKIKI